MKQLTRWTATLAMVALASAAQADLNRVGPPALPSPPGNGFPAWYQDLNGLTLDICLPNASGDTGQAQQAACLLTGVGIEPPYVFPTNYPDEIFYFRAVSDVLDTSANGAAGTNKAILVLALEAAFASGGAQAGQQIVFTRIRVTAGVPHAGTYTVTHPYGIETFVVDVATGARDIFFSEDIGINPGAFTDALSSRVGPFLQASAIEGGAPKAPVTINGASFLSDGVALEILTGSPFGTNYFEMCGPFDGAANPDTCRKTPLFSLTGRLHSGLIGSPLRVDRASYSRFRVGRAGRRLRQRQGRHRPGRPEAHHRVLQRLAGAPQRPDGARRVVRAGHPGPGQRDPEPAHRDEQRRLAAHLGGGARDRPRHRQVGELRRRHPHRRGDHHRQG